LAAAGGSFHSDLYGKQGALPVPCLQRTGAAHLCSSTFLDSFGTSIYTSKPLPAGSEVVTCPFSLAVTPTLARSSVPSSLFPSSPSPSSSRKTRQPNHELMALYVLLHLLPSALRERVEGLDLQHSVYVDALPKPESMRTTLYFTEGERELLRGSNLFGATEDRENGWREEWEEVRGWIGVEEVREEVTWERWLWACTILSYVTSSFSYFLISSPWHRSIPLVFYFPPSFSSSSCSPWTPHLHLSLHRSLYLLHPFPSTSTVLTLRRLADPAPSPLPSSTATRQTQPPSSSPESTCSITSRQRRSLGPRTCMSKPSGRERTPRRGREG
jgi:hypothetical protein